MYGPRARVIERNILKEMSEEFGVTSESFIEAAKSIQGLNDKPD